MTLLNSKTAMKTVAVFCWFMAFVPMLFVPNLCVDAKQVSAPPMVDTTLMEDK